MQQFVAVLFVLLALWGTVALLRRKGFALSNARRGKLGQAPLIEHLDRLRLTPAHSIHLLRIEDARVLIAVHPQGVTVLDGRAAGIPAISAVLKESLRSV